MQFDVQLADIGDHIQVIAGAFDLGVDPWARAFTHEGDGVIEGPAGDAGVDGRLDQLRDGALDVRAFADAPVLYHQFGVHRYPVKQHGAAGGGALAEARPIVNDAQPLRATAHKSHDLFAVIVQRLHLHPMGKQRAGGVELLAADHVAVAFGGEPRFEFQGVFGAAFRAAITDAPAVEDALEQLFFLAFGGSALQQIQDAEVVLRDLPEGRVRRADDREHLGQGHERYLWAAVFTGNGNTAEPTGIVRDPGRGVRDHQRGRPGSRT